MARIIYYSWDEYIKQDGIESVRRLGHEVKEFRSIHEKYDFDERNMTELKKTIDSFSPDIIFSFNYFPDVSRVSMEKGITYISLVYDCPHYTLESETLKNECNRIYIFDSNLVRHYKSQGISNVYYSPLPARIINRKSAGNSSGRNAEYKYDISFVGSLYDGAQNQYDQIDNFPDRLKGKLDGIICGQHQIYGADIIDALVDDRLFSEVKNYVSLSLGEHYNSCEDLIFRNILKRRVTMTDRISSLVKLGNVAKLDLFTGSSLKTDSIINHGIVDHERGLVNVLQESRININISLRSISAGIPLRVMHILGCGGFCLTNYQADLNMHFENEKHLVWYYSEEDMTDKAQFYLKHESEREKIAAMGYELVSREYSYDRLFQAILISNI